MPAASSSTPPNWIHSTVWLRAAGEGIAATRKKLEQEARAQMAQPLTQCRGEREIDLSGEVISGNPVSSIPARADALNADLLLLGSRGESFLHHALLGSTASRLLRRGALRQPVLVIKQAPQHAYRRIMIATDLSPATINAIQAARQLAPNAEIVLLHLLDLPFASKLSYADVAEKDIQCYIQIEREKCQTQLHTLAERAGLSVAGLLHRRRPWTLPGTDRRTGAGTALRPDRHRQTLHPVCRRTTARQHHPARAGRITGGCHGHPRPLSGSPGRHPHPGVMNVSQRLPSMGDLLHSQDPS